MDKGPPKGAGGADEVTLDIEVALGLAPGTKFLVYEAPNNGDKGTVDEYARIVSDDKAQVISSSWGGCELLGSDPAGVKAQNTIFELAAAQGQSLYVAAGDTGSTGCLSNGSASETGTGGLPVAEAVDPGDGTVYVANSGVSGKVGPSIAVVSESQDATLGTLPLPAGSAPDGIAVDPTTHLVFVSLSGSGVVEYLHGATCNANKGSNAGCALKSVSLEDSKAAPAGIAVDPKTKTVYVAAPGADGVAVLGESGGTSGSVRFVTGSAITGKYEPYGIAVDVTNNRVWFTIPFQNGSLTDQVALIYGANCDAASTSKCGWFGPALTGSEPVSVTVDVSLGALFVANRLADSVTVLDAASGSSLGSVLGTIHLGAAVETPVGVSLSPSGGQLLVACAGVVQSGGQIAKSGLPVVSLSGSTTGEVTTVLPEAGAEPVAIVSDPATFFAWSADYASGGVAILPLFLNVQDPASQPFVTSVGGTSLLSIGPAPKEAVWDETLPGNGASSGGGGSGGISENWAMPHYQFGPGVITKLSSGAPCGLKSGDCREVPDVSASADPYHGYVVFFQNQWQGGNGGTSAAAPLWAAMTALIDVDQAKLRPVGFLNPVLYQIEAGTKHVLNDVTVGNNDMTTTNGGRYPATKGYDMATGLGTPDALAIAEALVTATVPKVTKVSPASGPAKGGTEVTVTGTGLGWTSEVLFGKVPSFLFAAESATKVLVFAPPGKGTVAVTVRTPGGASAPVKGGTFTY